MFSSFVDFPDLNLRACKTHVTREYWLQYNQDPIMRDAWLHEPNWSFSASAQTNPRIPATHIRYDEILQWIAQVNEIESTAWRLPSTTEALQLMQIGQDITTMTADDIYQQAIVYDNSGGVINPVSKKAPTPAGLYDVIGLVSTWCSDRKTASGYSWAATVGGSWSHSIEACKQRKIRWHWTQIRSDIIGFRLVATLTEAAQASKQQRGSDAYIFST